MKNILVVNIYSTQQPIGRTWILQSIATSPEIKFRSRYIEHSIYEIKQFRDHGYRPYNIGRYWIWVNTEVGSFVCISDFCAHTTNAHFENMPYYKIREIVTQEDGQKLLKELKKLKDTL